VKSRPLGRLAVASQLVCDVRRVRHQIHRRDSVASELVSDVGREENAADQLPRYSRPPPFVHERTAADRRPRRNSIRRLLSVRSSGSSRPRVGDEPRRHTSTCEPRPVASQLACDVRSRGPPARASGTSPAATYPPANLDLLRRSLSPTLVAARLRRSLRLRSQQGRCHRRSTRVPDPVNDGNSTP